VTYVKKGSESGRDKGLPPDLGEVGADKGEELPPDLGEVGVGKGRNFPKILGKYPPNHACGFSETYRVCDGVIADVVSDKQLTRRKLASQTQKTFFISGLDQLMDQRRGGDERL
jgi:hypothetical protein